MKTARNLIKASGLLRIVLISFLLFFSYLIFSANPVHALDATQESSNYINRAEAENVNDNNVFNTSPDVPKNFHSVVQIVVLETLSATVCQLAGVDLLSPDHKCLGVNPKTGQIGFVEKGGGLLAVAGSLIDFTFVPPASSGQYVAYLGDNFGIAKSVNAQFQGGNNPCRGVTGGPQNRRGVGFCGLEPILPIWVAMRNIVYLILIIVFVIIGLGIMLRIHIDPRTVMTLQNQIPKIIVGIVAITFSFAIAGFLIDVMWVAIYLFAGVITSATATTTYAIDSATMTSVVQSGTPFDAANTTFNFDGNFFNNGILGIAEETSKAFASLIQAAVEGKRDQGPAFDLLGGVVNIIAFVVILIAIIVALLRLWVTLIISYINIILDVIFAPFWILAGLLPGSSLGVGAWLRDLIANLAVFPVAIAFFLLANYLVHAFQDANGIATSFVPPLMGGTNALAVAALIGFGFILMLPNVMNTVKAALKTPKLNFGPIMGPISSSAGFIGGVPKRVTEIGGRSYYAHQGEGRWNKVGRFFGNPYYFGGGKSSGGGTPPSH